MSRRQRNRAVNTEPAANTAPDTILKSAELGAAWNLSKTLFDQKFTSTSYSPFIPFSCDPDVRVLLEERHRSARDPDSRAKLVRAEGAHFSPVNWPALAIAWTGYAGDKSARESDLVQALLQDDGERTADALDTLSEPVRKLLAKYAGAAEPVKQISAVGLWCFLIDYLRLEHAPVFNPRAEEFKCLTHDDKGAWLLRELLRVGQTDPLEQLFFFGISLYDFRVAEPYYCFLMLLDMLGIGQEDLGNIPAIADRNPVYSSTTDYYLFRPLQRVLTGMFSSYLAVLHGYTGGDIRSAGTFKMQWSVSECLKRLTSYAVDQNPAPGFVKSSMDETLVIIQRLFDAIDTEPPAPTTLRPNGYNTPARNKIHYFPNSPSGSAKAFSLVDSGEGYDDSDDYEYNMLNSLDYIDNAPLVTPHSAGGADKDAAGILPSDEEEKVWDGFH